MARRCRPKSVRNTQTVLRKALSDAERLGLIARNPAAAARPPAADRKEQRTWSGDELRDFLVAIGEDRLFSLYVLMATTGMRRGEALGLRWTDLDLDGQQLHIVQTLAAVNYRPVFSTPKTKRSRRLVYLDADTIRVLRSHRARQREERLAAGPAWAGDEYQLDFTDELGGPINPDWVSGLFVGEMGGARQSGLATERRVQADACLTGATSAGPFDSRFLPWSRGAGPQ